MANFSGPIIRPSRGLFLPGGVPKIDWTNPLTKGLIGCWVATGEGGGVPVIRDLVSQTFLSPTGSPSIVATGIGMQAKDTASNGWTQSTLASHRPTTAFSVLWMGSIYGAGVNATYFPGLIAGYTNTTFTSPALSWGLVRRGSPNIYLYWNNGTSQNIEAVSSLTSGSWGSYCYVGTMSAGNNAYIYKNGILVQSGAAPAGSITYGATAITAVGIAPGAITSYTNAGLCVGMLWNRQISHGEAAQLGVNPTAFLLYPTDLTRGLLGLWYGVKYQAYVTGFNNSGSTSLSAITRKSILASSSISAGEAVSKATRGAVSVGSTVNAAEGLASLHKAAQTASGVSGGVNADTVSATVTRKASGTAVTGNMDEVRGAATRTASATSETKSTGSSLTGAVRGIIVAGFAKSLDTSIGAYVRGVAVASATKASATVSSVASRAFSGISVTPVTTDSSASVARVGAFGISGSISGVVAKLGYIWSIRGLISTIGNALVNARRVGRRPTVIAVMVSSLVRVQMTSSLVRVIMVPSMSSPTPVQLNDMRQSTIDARGIDLTCALTPGDTVYSITSITVRRYDGQPIGSNDLSISPAGFSAPWITANSQGVANLVINWFQSVGAAGSVLYVVTVSFVASSGTPLIYDCYQYVSATLG